MSWTVTTEGGCVVFSNNAASWRRGDIVKPLGYCAASTDGDTIIIANSAGQGEEIIRADYTDFSDPTAASAAELRNILNSQTLFDTSQQVGFVTTANLGIGASYTSDLLNVSGFTQVQTEILSDQDGTIDIRFCSDSAGLDAVRTLSIPYVAANGYQLFAAPAFVDHIEYTFTNTSGAPITDFYFTTKLLTTALSPQTLRLDGFLSPAMMGNVVRSIIAGRNKAGTYNNVALDSANHLKVNVDDPRTAFGQIKVAEETNVISQQFPYAINERVVTKTEANGGTVSWSDSQAVLQTSTNAAGSAKMVTRQAMKYQPGTGAIIRFTGAFTTGVANSTQIIGYGDDTDGFFIGYNGAAFGILQRQDGVDSWVALSAANVDILDGNGGSTNPSNINLDPTQGNVYQIKFQWLGYGAIIFYVEDENTGDFEPFHIIKYANSYVIPSIYAPSLPILWEVTNSGNATNLTLLSASAMASLEGRRVFTGPKFTQLETGVTANHVLTIRNDASNVLGGTNTNRHSIYIIGFSATNDGVSTSSYTLEINAALTTPSFAKYSANESIVSIDTAGTLGASGDIVDSATVPKNQGVTTKYNLNENSQQIEIRPGETLSVRCSNTNATDFALIWLEDI